MLKLEKTEYDLNTLFSFDVLKEILLKLAKSQIKLENEINEIKEKLENKEDELQSVEEEENYFNNNITNQNINNNIYNANNQENNKEDNSDINENNVNKEQNMNQNKQNDEKESKENKDNKENKVLNNNENINIDQNKKIDNVIEDKNEEKENHEIKQENIHDKKETEKEKENKTEDKIINEEKNIIIKKSEIPETHIRINEKEKTNIIPNSSTKMNIPTSPSRAKPATKTMKITSTSNHIPGANVSPDVITKIMKQIKLLQSKMNDMNKSFNSEINSIKNFNSHFTNFDSQLNLIKEKINSLMEKSTENDKKFENLQVKVANFDVFSMFQDSGDGTIDATKILVKSLEDKVFKKFELIDERYKVDSLENIKIKNNMDNIMPKIAQFNTQIEKINENENKYQEELFNIKKENEDNNNEIKNVLNNDINITIENIKNNMEQNIENKLSDLEQKINELKNNNGDNYDILKLGLRNNDINQDTIDSLDKKITDLRKKMHDINNTLKLYMSNNETDSIKNELKDLKILLDKKITKDDLKELYNYHMNTSDEINDLKDQTSLTFEDLRKTAKDINNIQQKIESINGNLSLLQDNPKLGNAPIIDFAKYIDQAKLTETLRPLLKEMEKLYKEIDSVRRDLSVVDEENKRYVKNQINKLDEEINKKINDLKNLLQKKYLEKIDFNKNIKTLEVQIKSLGDESKKDADSWLLAKRPLKCFNCASCEANIKNDYNSADYLPWKKYPKGEKIHRMGQGFSHMLQMMTSEFVKSIERNELNQDLEINTKNNFGNPNNISNNFNEKINFNNNNIIINNKDNNSNNDFIKNLKRSKMKLPKVHPNSNSKIKKYKLEDTLPVSDDDINYAEEINNNNINEDEMKANSPKILKIYKKRGKESYDNMGPTTMRNEHITRNNEFAKKFNFMKTDRNLYYKEE